VEETVQVVAHGHRRRRRHKKRAERPAKIDPATMAIAILLAFLAGLFCVWQMMRPGHAVESLESLQQFLPLSAAGMRDAFLFR